MSPSIPVRCRAWSAIAFALFLAAEASAQTPVGAGFTYQGSLAQSGAIVNGLYDFQFKLYDAGAGGTQMGGTIVANGQSVTGGVFTVELDFGSSWFIGEARWLEVAARPTGSVDPYLTFPRQKLSAVPYAVGLSLPVDQVYNSSGFVFQMRNSGLGGAAQFQATGAATNYAVLGKNSSTGFNAAGVRGEGTAASGNSIGVEGVAMNSSAGAGVVGRGNSVGGYFEGQSPSGNGVMAYGYTYGLYARNWGTGPAAYLTGQGQTKTNATLRVENTQPSQGMAAYLHCSSTFATTHIQNDGTGQVLWLTNAGSGNFIVAENATGWKFWVDQNGKTTTKVLEIIGGADLSEQFDIGSDGRPVEPGMVVSIDGAREGRLERCERAYDRKVAGIVSGAGGVHPGMLMGQQGSVADGDVPVALTGRVYCWVDASYGAVEPGDLLTTSDTPGHAMKAVDHDRSQGAILGKAMGRLGSGRGLVLVLVGLQ